MICYDYPEYANVNYIWHFNEFYWKMKLMIKILSQNLCDERNYENSSAKIALKTEYSQFKNCLKKRKFAEINQQY